ncbi:peroxisome biogenesis factor 1 isoform X3 [Nilaparvata lugens]|uniref:peroxisome biogenesis factor 1 isoform X3 n=1 Tax=Nilaparvata lugens TaxID=108931 RepID=UPI00193CA35F|nr:peroxisome biogenesis factor 1 isoform X3 [Nilaparvata lugens]
MIEQIFNLDFLLVRDCFLHLPYSWLRKLNCENKNPPTVKLTQDDRIFHLTCSPHSNSGLNENSIGVSGIYANNLGLKEGYVCVSSVGEPPPIRVVHACAMTDDDYEMIEMSQTELELAILNQIQVVSIGQPITVWLSKSLHCNLVIDKLDPPIYFGKLMNLTEIVIEPTVSSRKSDDFLERKIDAMKNDDNKESSNSTDMDSLHFNSSIDTETKNNKHSGVFRVVVVEENSEQCCDDLHNPLKNPYNVFVSKDIATWWRRKPVIERYASVCSLRKIPKASAKTLTETPNIYVRLYAIDESCHQLPTVKNGSNWRHQPLFISPTVKDLLKLSNGAKIKLDLFSPCLDETLSKVELIAPLGLDHEEVETWFRSKLLATGNVLVNNEAPLPMLTTDKVENINVVLDPASLTCWPFSAAEVQTCTLTIKDAQIPEDSDKSKITEDQTPEESKSNENHTSNLETINPQNCRALKKIIKDGICAVELALNLIDAPWMRNTSHMKGSKNILITGSGNKSSADSLCDILSGRPHFVYISKIDCKSLRGKKVDTIEKTLKQTLGDSIYHQPAVLLLYDIDALVGNPIHTNEESAENNPWAQTIHQTCLMLKDIISDIEAFQSVSLLATAQSIKSVSKDLIRSKSHGFFSTVLEIPPLSQEDRIDILKEMLRQKLKIGVNAFENINLDAFAEKTDNYVFEDLQQIVNKVCFKAWIRKSEGSGESELTVTSDDISFAIDSVSPSHLKTIKLFKNSKHNWNSIGGMKKLKDTLTELIIWPAKYRKIYEQCPLKSENGVLLYGLPGSGKTLIASALAGECNLNFISVKGPELLSKYIGASEENVRNIFERAQKAKPCILFFDEFDSLVPRRGHDNTGVTDRVVNQMLTQLDGVEERRGVWVMAATSRPDLIDPALLRPGRIGHNLHCRLPTQEERFEILQVIGKDLPLSSACDFRDVSDKTENFTGADLKSLLYSAHMIAYEEMEDSENNEVGSSGEPSGAGYELKQSVVGKLSIEHRHLLSALKDAKPSLKESELQRYNRIYDSFKMSRSKTGAPIQERAPELLQQTVTLA